VIAATKHALAIAKAIELSIPGEDSPVGYRDTPESFRHAVPGLLAELVGKHPLQVTGFSCFNFALDWLASYAEGPCIVWTDTQGFVKVGINEN